MHHARFAAALAASLLLSAPARAGSPPAAPEPSALIGPVVGRDTELRVERESLAYVYAGAARDRVQFEARFTVVNPSGAREELAIAFYRWDVEAFRVTVDGDEHLVEPTAGDYKDLEMALSAPASNLLGDLRRLFTWLGATGPHPERVAFRVAADPGARHEIVISGRARGRPQHRRRGFAVDAVVARHLLLGTERPEVELLTYDFEVAPIGRWKDAPLVDASITYPSSWRRPSLGDDEGDWRARSAGGSTVLTRTISTREARALRIEVDSGYSRFRNGGPLLAIGGSIGPTRAVRGRFGYEVAAPGWLLYSLTVDTDFRKRAIVTPGIEAASSALLFLPSAGIGVGVPVQVAPDRRVGARILGDLHFYPVGFVASVDVFPKLGSLPTMVELSLLGQVAF